MDGWIDDVFSDSACANDGIGRTHPRFQGPYEHRGPFSSRGYVEASMLHVYRVYVNGSRGRVHAFVLSSQLQHVVGAVRCFIFPPKVCLCFNDPPRHTIITRDVPNQSLAFDRLIVTHFVSGVVQRHGTNNNDDDGITIIIIIDDDAYL